MQLIGATPLEKECYDLCHRCESELPAGKLSTDIVVALSNASNELQRLRGFWPPGDTGIRFHRGKDGNVIVINSGTTIEIPKNHWCSDIAQVSYHGEEDGGFYRAAQFHYGQPIHETVYCPQKPQPESWKDK